MDSTRSSLPRLLAWVAFVLLGTVLTVSLHLGGLPRVLAHGPHRPCTAPGSSCSDEAYGAPRTPASATAVAPSGRCTTG